MGFRLHAHALRPWPLAQPASQPASPTSANVPGSWVSFVSKPNSAAPINPKGAHCSSGTYLDLFLSARRLSRERCRLTTDLPPSTAGRYTGARHRAGFHRTTPSPRGGQTGQGVVPAQWCIHAAKGRHAVILFGNRRPHRHYKVCVNRSLPPSSIPKSSTTTPPTTTTIPALPPVHEYLGQTDPRRRRSPWRMATAEHASTCQRPLEWTGWIDVEYPGAGAIGKGEHVVP